MTWHRFHYGPMGVGKSTLVLEAWERSQPAAVLLSGGHAVVASRNGTSAPVTATVDVLDGVDPAPLVLVDEAHMLTPAHVDRIVTWADDHGADVHAYGLLLDFRGVLFAATRAWLERVDEAVALPITVTCWCGAPASRNGRVVGGAMVVDGPQLLVGDLTPADTSYVSLCRTHWRDRRPHPG